MISPDSASPRNAHFGQFFVADVGLLGNFFAAAISHARIGETPFAAADAASMAIEP